MDRKEIETRVRKAADATGIPYEWLPINPRFSDTAEFCAQYGFPLESAANTILIVGKGSPKSYCACMILATSKLDVNRSVKKILGVKASFASRDEMAEKTEMEFGAVTPFGLDERIPVYVDARVFDQPWIIAGAGIRDAKIKIASEALRKLHTVRMVDDLGVAREA